MWMLQIVTMAGVYALACAMAEVRSYSVGQHLGSAIVVTFGAGALTHFLPGMPDLASWQLTAIHALSATLGAWLITQVISRLFYGASGNEVQTMSIVAGIGNGLTVLFWTWAMSP
jgi:hypothetical protein